MTDYTKFDAALLGKVKAGYRWFSEIHRGPLAVMAREIGEEDFRITDRRLQALRKAGKLTFDRKAGWRVV